MNKIIDVPRKVKELIDKIPGLSLDFYLSRGEAIRDAIDVHPHLLVYFLALEKGEIPDNIPLWLLKEIVDCFKCRMWFMTEPELFIKLKEKLREKVMLAVLIKTLMAQVKEKNEKKEMEVERETVEILERKRERDRVEEIKFYPSTENIEYSYLLAAASEEEIPLLVKINIVGEGQYIVKWIPGTGRILVERIE